MSMTAQNYYDNAWKQVDQSESKALATTALKQVDAIYQKAVADKNDQQQIKALIYKLRYNAILNDSSLTTGMALLDNHIKAAIGPKKAILYSMKGEILHTYLQNHQYGMRDRTSIADDKNTDIRTWSIDKLNEEITSAYEASLADPTALKKATLDNYQVIISQGENAKHLRPTLYDLLISRALAYFDSGESSLTKPTNAFELTDPTAFAPAATFAQHKFTSTDSSSHFFKALLLRQQLIAFHLNDGSKNALADADIDRISAVNNVSVADNKADLYRKALETAMKAYEQVPEGTKAIMLLANTYLEGTPLYLGNNEGYSKTQKEGVATALSLCDLAIKTFGDSFGGVECYNIRERILDTEMSFQLEQVNIPGQPFRVFTQFRNLKTVYFRIFSVSDAILKTGQLEVQAYEEEKNQLNKVLAQTPVKEWSQQLPDPGDHLPHSTEVKADGLPSGSYLVVASTDKAFDKKKNIMIGCLTAVSNIAFITRGSLVYALDRTTGEPLAGAKLEVRTQPNNYDKLPLTTFFTGVTDADGKLDVKYKNSNDYNTRQLKWNYKDDSLLVRGYSDYSFRIYGKEAKENAAPETVQRTYMFTDRGIYRPGQIAYFKGIVLEETSGKLGKHVKAGLDVRVQLLDVNQQVVDSIRLKSNDFGSFAGKFVLPSDRLPGNYSIKETVTNGFAIIKVEEYKRPKFEVTFDDVKQEVRLGDTVNITGKAIAYAGNNINNAQVSYTVKRGTRFPYPWMSDKIFPMGASQEISHGTTTTAADGSFKINFDAIPDRKIDPAGKPVFSYEVFASVTDINGETRSQTMHVSAGYVSILATVSIPEATTQKGLEEINVKTTNLNDQYAKTSLTLKLSPLQPEQRLLRGRYWSQPDTFVYSKEEYVKLFPTDIYKNEDKPESWPVKTAVYEKTLTSQENGKLKPAFPQLAPGYYKLEVSATSEKGETVKQQVIFSVQDEAKPQMLYPQYNWVYQEKANLKAGDKGKVQLASAKSAYVLQQYQSVQENDKMSFFKLNGTATKEYPVTANDEGAVYLVYSWVRDNRFLTRQVSFNVSQDKDLKIELAAHRDKLQPGEKEKWTVKIKGADADKAGAELLAGMYDASLDALYPFTWSVPAGRQNYGYPSMFSMSSNSGTFSGNEISSDYNELARAYSQEYPSINWFNWDLSLDRDMDTMRYAPRMMVGGSRQKTLGEPNAVEAQLMDAAPAPAMAKLKDTVESEKSQGSAAGVQARKDFRETAFFLPDLRTDKDGNIAFEFTMPEALTKWKFQGLAHTPDAAFGKKEAEIVTQKPLMVQTFAPRFLREGDKIDFSAKISNLSDSQVIGQARLELLDAATMQPVDGWFQNIFPVQHFTANAGQSAAVVFPMQIPNAYGSTLIYRVTATAGSFTDGEENALPVLTNSMLVTETLPVWMQGDGTKNLTFQKLKDSESSSTLQQHGLTVEYTSNPAWYAVQALPYLMEYPHDCAEQVFNRYYANSLAAWIVKQQPAIADIFAKWKNEDSSALVSNLEKNEELKSILLQQTPWVLDAKSESAQKRQIATLFDTKTINSGARKAISQLADKQASNGAFPWFTGMSDDRYITQYIVAGIGRLTALTGIKDDQLKNMANKALNYMDQRIVADYKNLLKTKADLKKQHIDGIALQYLYARSFFGAPKSVELTTAWNYYLGLAKKDWTSLGLYQQAMAALLFNRLNDQPTATAIVKSLKENAVVSPEMGMYWKANNGGYYWYQAPVETQSLLIEAFSNVTHDQTAVNQMKTWLLKNKQTNNWKTTKATADACYAMLIGGSNWLSATPEVNIKLGNVDINSNNTKAEAGTGYLKEQVSAKTVKPDMGNITVTVKGSKGQPSWGAVYWQYFEQLDKITSAGSPLSIQKELYKEVNTDKGPVLTKLTDNNELKVGDKLKVRIILRSDRNMEYIHLMDMRAAAFEPQNVLSGAKWQNGLSYYESTKDVSTDFFFSYLPKGTYVFEYAMNVTHNGTFSNGISTVQCMYAPEFNAHSEGVILKVRE
ncbi:alpha-2-macroglobulin [Chitinophaga sp. Cy-1792]|uniref:alpha-2-macroglobulin family protein n=1 Tax=Chitinophaga sp. Cy-1792 TaxID=2608339 RepID=UPI00141F0518|nr:alpha-2-macroglobulin family protein [Chitinophaga sp. Cy-1792]